MRFISRVTLDLASSDMTLQTEKRQGRWLLAARSLDMKDSETLGWGRLHNLYHLLEAPVDETREHQWSRKLRNGKPLNPNQ